MINNDIDNSKDIKNNSNSSTIVDDNSQKKNKEKHRKDTKPKKNIWWIKAIVITLVLAAFVSYLSELTAASGNVAILIVLLFLLIFLSIIFDCIGVAVTSCDITPIISMSSRKIYGAKTALALKKHSDTVSSVCNDIVGDIFGIISGTCSAALVVKIALDSNIGDAQTWVAIAFSACVSALTIGGKAFMKNIAVNKSNQIVMFVSKILAIFSKEERKRRKKEKSKQEKYKSNENR